MANGIKSLYEIRREAYEAEMLVEEAERELEEKIDAKCDDPTTADISSWKVRKWEDGTMEARRTISVNITFSRNYGTYIHYKEDTSAWNLPSGFIETPVLISAPVDGELISVVIKDLTSANFKMNYIRFTNTADTSISSYKIALYAVGKWK